MSSETTLSKSGRNNAIDIYRLVCAVMVVYGHTHANRPDGANAVYYCTQVLRRMSVPFFFAVAGFFYTGALLSGKKVYRKYVTNLVIVYSLWSAVYFTVKFFMQVVFGGERFFSFVAACIPDFFISGSYYHFWFFPALFFSVTFVTVCHKLKMLKLAAFFSILLYIVGCLGCSYYGLGSRIPFMPILLDNSHFTFIRRAFLMGFPFFMMGYFLHAFKAESVKNKTLIVTIIISIALFILEYFFVIGQGLQRSIYLTVMLYPLLMQVIMLLLKNPAPNLYSLGRRTRLMSNFIFYSHPLLLLLFSEVFHMADNVMFVLAASITGLIGLAVSYSNKKWLNVLVK